MRFMVLVKSDATIEGGALPSQEELAEMSRFNEELVNAGVMLAGEGLQPSAKGARIRYENRKATVVDGPFAEAKELVAGFWILQARSKEEVLEWMKRAPFVNAEVEIRQVLEAEDFAPSDPTGELREAEQRLRERVESRQA